MPADTPEVPAARTDGAPPTAAGAASRTKPATSRFAARRRRDRIVAAVITVLVVLIGTVLYLTSDIRATHPSVAPDRPPIAAMQTVPEALVTAWQQPIDPELGVAVSPFGTVAIADRHSVVGRSAEAGAVVWSYTRSNRDVCAIGSGDTTTGDVKSTDSVRGIMAMYARNGMCQEMATFNPITGEVLYQRTAPNKIPGTLVFGGPYAAWMSSDLLEIWRGSLVRTFQYGNQPTPKSAGTEHLGCTFIDAATGRDQFGTIEHCASKGPNARIVLNWTDPHHEKPDDWTDLKTKVRADIDTGSPVARIVGITKDRVAVLVTVPGPAVLLYDADGKMVTRTPISISAKAIAADNGITPRVTLNGVQYSFVGGNVISVSTREVEVTVPVTSTAAASSTEPAFPGSATRTTQPTTTTEPRESMTVNWTMSQAIGLPTLVGGSLLVPSSTGLAVTSPDDGKVSRTIDVSRADSPKRVDVSVVGDRLIELRGGQLVALKAS